MFIIPFPDVKIDYKKISLIYSWSWETDKEVRIVFNTNDRSLRDFWYGFDLVQQKYTSHGKAY